MASESMLKHTSPTRSISARKTQGNIEEIEYLINLLHKGDIGSLMLARKQMGVNPESLSELIGVPVKLLSAWEEGREIPLPKHLISLRLKLGDFVDERIADLIGTDNKELITQFWEIMWRLSDLNPH